MTSFSSVSIGLSVCVCVWILSELEVGTRLLSSSAQIAKEVEDEEEEMVRIIEECFFLGDGG